MRRHLRGSMVLAMAMSAVACGDLATDEAAAPKPPAAPGIDLDRKVITIGMLNDESGPVASIGRPFAVGKRIIRQEVNSEGSELLPDGWTIEHLERDHGSDPQRAVDLFNDIRARILFISTSLGTATTLPLRPLLERHRIVAFPVSLSAKMREFAYTPPVAPSTGIEAARALDWLVKEAGGPEKVKLGLVYQQDEYGRGGLEAVADASQLLGIKVLASQAYAAGQVDYAPIVKALKEVGARDVILVTVPSATGPILDIAAGLDYRPTWIGASPSWTDRFFDATLVPPGIFDTYHRTSGTAFWGEKKVAFMEEFLAAYEKFGRQLSAPDYYVMLGYVQGRLTVEVMRRMIESGDLSRAGFMNALRSMKDYDSRGAVADKQDFSAVPYKPGKRVRVLKPDFAKRTWTEIGPYAEPTTMRPRVETLPPKAPAEKPGTKAPPAPKPKPAPATPG